MVTHNSTYEKGNAVTLTLLGLSVAILAGVVVLYFVGRAKPEPVYTPDSADEAVFDSENEPIENPREGWNTYTNTTYNFSVEYPDGWLVATGTLQTGDPAISLYQATDTSMDTGLVFDHFDQTAHVSVYPHGIATEGILAKMQASDVVVGIPQAAAKDYVLQTGRPWATRVTFDVFPSSWNESGFVFARLKVEEEELIYKRGDTEIAQHVFDPLTGDHVERTGFVDTNMREIQTNILKSFRFVDGEGEEQTITKELVSIEAPKAGMLVESPLMVLGTTKSGWYYEDDFLIRLVTGDGSVITEASVTPKGDTDEEGYVPFEVSLVFDTPTATSGNLVIGIRDRTQAVATDTVTSVSVPVLFIREDTEPLQVN
jgi:hypothetical protein